MTARCFADTNLFLYAASKAPEDVSKREIARRVIASEDIGISAQVLQEFIAVAFSKKRLGITSDETRETLSVLLEYPVVPISGDLVREAFDLCSRFQISYWDAAIIAAAHELSSKVIYSEDLNHGQDYGGVRVVNPFIQG
jgi:predicted nucleic acid-binding protein